MKINSSERKVDIKCEYSENVKCAAGFGFQCTGDSRSVSSAAGYSPSHGSTHKISHATARRLARVTALALALMLVLTVSVTVFAYVRIDTNASAGITVNYTEDNETGIVGVTFKLYKVADISDAVQYTATDAFAGAQIDWSGIPSVDSGDTSWWTTLATTLNAYVATSNITPTATGVTNEKGQIEFKNLAVGLYLLVGESKIIGDFLYSPSPSMVLLPTLDGTTDEWDYNPSVNVKYEKETLQEYTEITVEKIWDDNNYSGRPDSIIVELLRDGEVIDSAKLNDENGWRYTWSDLPVIKDLESGSVYTYTVNESGVPDGYRVKIEQNGNVYRITNTYEEPEEPTRPEEPTEPETPVAPGTPDNPGTPSNPSNPSSPSEPKLPQTGQLNWPIPLLSIGGLLMILAGLYLKRRKA